MPRRPRSRPHRDFRINVPSVVVVVVVVARPPPAAAAAPDPAPRLRRLPTSATAAVACATRLRGSAPTDHRRRFPARVGIRRLACAAPRPPATAAASQPARASPVRPPQPASSPPIRSPCPPARPSLALRKE
uniref:Uncharacterized protein n=1 Tax=Oryza sativa subsp. japonica TaxID=39947 RepID=Q6Z4T2_ORYSJ|nr:hypothetical protein [Oryza sativa Japonica Group]BAD05557.1 hypothetical protein [Oryza sativa Japonica Group]